MFNRPFTFSGNEYIATESFFKSLVDDFTYECIFLPEELNLAVYNRSSYLISPTFSTDIDTAVVGISVNGNEIRVLEKSLNITKTRLLVHFDNTILIKLVLVYANKIPSLFINGELIAVGLKSQFKHVYPSGVLGGNQEGECFLGKIDSIKLWNKSLSREKIVLLNLKNNICNENLVWGHDFLNGSFYKSGEKIKPKISIILPTYNKYSQLLLTLHSLECQTFPKQEFEVIIADDGSQDQTPSIFNDHSFSFHLKYLRSNYNIGRPKIRNLGIQNASGNIIIFLDAEILVKPDFVLQHYTTHMKKDNIVVCGSMVLKGIYTTYNPQLNAGQLAELKLNIQNYPPLLKKLAQGLEDRKPVQLLTEKDIYDKTFMKFSFEKPFVKFYQELFINYGNELKEFHFPWILFATGNISLKSQGFIEVGLFEEYPGYGWDDHELGYRLFKRGYSFINHTGLVAYHQEHPIAKSNNHEAFRNFVRMYRKFPEVQMRIIALHFLGISLSNINSIYNSYVKFLDVYPNDFMLVKYAFYCMLDQIALKLWNGQNLTNFFVTIPFDLNQLNIQLDKLMEKTDINIFATNFKNLINN